MEAKVFILDLKRQKGFLRGVIKGRKNVSSWLGVGLASLGFFLERVERSFQVKGEEGRSFQVMVKDANHAGPFVRLQVLDTGGRKFCIFVLSGRRNAKAWIEMACSLREMVIKPREGTLKSEEAGSGEEGNQKRKIEPTRKMVAGLSKSFAEVLNPSILKDVVVGVEIDERACDKKSNLINHYMVGCWNAQGRDSFNLEKAGKEMCQKWRLSRDLGLASLGEEKILLEFYSKEEAIQVLKRV